MPRSKILYSKIDDLYCPGPPAGRPRLIPPGACRTEDFRRGRCGYWHLAAPDPRYVRGFLHHLPGNGGNLEGGVVVVFCRGPMGSSSSLCSRSDGWVLRRFIGDGTPLEQFGERFLFLLPDVIAESCILALLPVTELDTSEC